MPGLVLSGFGPSLIINTKIAINLAITGLVLGDPEPSLSDPEPSSSDTDPSCSDPE